MNNPDIWPAPDLEQQMLAAEGWLGKFRVLSEVQDTCIESMQKKLTAAEAERDRFCEFCRRLVVCCDGVGDVFGLAEEVRAALSQTEPPGT